MPRLAKDYYGPNKALLAALSKDQNTWKMIYRHAIGDRVSVSPKVGNIQHRYPDIRVRTVNDSAEFTLSGGIGYIPITFGNLTSPKGYSLLVDGKKVDQSVHGNDFWQTDYDPVSGKWSQTYNIPENAGKTRVVQFRPSE